jgi:hypothetical protein
MGNKKEKAIQACCQVQLELAKMAKKQGVAFVGESGFFFFKFGYFLERFIGSRTDATRPLLAEGHRDKLVYKG